MSWAETAGPESGDVPREPKDMGLLNLSSSFRECGAETALRWSTGDAL